MSNGDISALSEKDGVEVLARNLCDIGFKYSWNIEDYLKGVDGKDDVDSPLFDVRFKWLYTNYLMSFVNFVEFT